MKGEGMREQMPQTAALVDWLREQLGHARADAIVLKGKKGGGSFYAAEIGPDGVLREFGSGWSGQRPVVADGGLQWPDGRGQPCSSR